MTLFYIGAVLMCGFGALDIFIRLRLKRAGYSAAFSFLGALIGIREYLRVRSKHGWSAWPIYVMWSLLISGFAVAMIGFFSMSHPYGRPAAMKVFQSYAKLEEKQDYIHIYDLLSDRYKDQLKREEKIQDGKDYEHLRLNSEAQWSRFQIVTIDVQDSNGFRFLVETRGEESGVVEDDKKFYYIVQDNGGWKIDRWSLVAAGTKSP